MNILEKNRFGSFGLIFLLRNDLGLVIWFIKIFMGFFYVFSSKNKQKHMLLEIIKKFNNQVKF
jgi:hypothetical protein